MYPKKEIALSELEIAGNMNPGPWTDHFKNVAKAASLIAEHCEGLDSEKAFVCGMLHDIGKKDITDRQYDFIRDYLNNLDYDDYDKLIILCDALADANGFCILEKRFIDTTRRYGIYPFSIKRWNKTYEYKDYFEKMTGRSIYMLLPDIEKCIYL